MLNTVAIASYRSLRELVLPLGPLNVVTGANGSGKSSLYRALRLLASTARGGVVGALAREGGLPSTLWAGPERISKAMRAGTQPVQGGRRDGPVRLMLGFSGDDLSYAIDLGLPGPTAANGFFLDPEIKREVVWGGPVFRPSAVLADRRGPLVTVRSDDGALDHVTTDLHGTLSMLSELADPRRAPEVLRARYLLRDWRFYDHFRSDPDAPARRAQVGTFTPVLADDGRDLAAALQTIRAVGDAAGLDQAIDHAFPGSTLSIDAHDGWFELTLSQHGLLRPLRAAELSDGTLRYLLWVAALLTPRPPSLMVINEPETSLHADLLPALASRIVEASARSQVWVITHSAVLAEHLLAVDGCEHHELIKELGETRLAGQDALSAPRWSWPPR